MFGSWKNWLVRNNSIMFAALLVAFGALLYGDGLTILYKN